MPIVLSKSSSVCAMANFKICLVVTIGLLAISAVKAGSILGSLANAFGDRLQNAFAPYGGANQNPNTPNLIMPGPNQQPGGINTPNQFGPNGAFPNGNNGFGPGDQNFGVPGNIQQPNPFGTNPDVAQNGNGFAGGSNSPGVLQPSNNGIQNINPFGYNNGNNGVGTRNPTGSLFGHYPDEVNGIGSNPSIPANPNFGSNIPGVTNGGIPPNSNFGSSVPGVTNGGAPSNSNFGPNVPGVTNGEIPSGPNFGSNGGIPTNPNSGSNIPGVTNGEIPANANFGSNVPGATNDGFPNNAFGNSRLCRSRRQTNSVPNQAGQNYPVNAANDVNKKPGQDKVGPVLFESEPENNGNGNTDGFVDCSPGTPFPKGDTNNGVTDTKNNNSPTNNGAISQPGNTQNFNGNGNNNGMGVEIRQSGNNPYEPFANNNQYFNNNQPNQPFNGINQPSQPFNGINQPSQPFNGINQPSQPFNGINQPNQPFGGNNQPSQPFNGVNQPFNNINQPTQAFNGINQPSQPFNGVNQPNQPFNNINQPTQAFNGINQPSQPFNGNTGIPQGGAWPYQNQGIGGFPNQGGQGGFPGGFSTPNSNSFGQSNPLYNNGGRLV